MIRNAGLDVFLELLSGRLRLLRFHVCVSKKKIPNCAKLHLESV